MMLSMLPSFLIGVVLGAVCTYTIYDAIDWKSQTTKQRLHELTFQNNILRQQVQELERTIRDSK